MQFHPQTLTHVVLHTVVLETRIAKASVASSAPPRRGFGRDTEAAHQTLSQVRPARSARGGLRRMKGRRGGGRGGRRMVYGRIHCCCGGIECSFGCRRLALIRERTLRLGAGATRRQGQRGREYRMRSQGHPNRRHRRHRMLRRLPLEALGPRQKVW